MQILFRAAIRAALLKYVKFKFSQRALILNMKRARNLRHFRGKTSEPTENSSSQIIRREIFDTTHHD